MAPSAFLWDADSRDRNIDITFLDWRQKRLVHGTGRHMYVRGREEKEIPSFW